MKVRERTPPLVSESVEANEMIRQINSPRL